MFSSLSARSKVGETRDLNWFRNTLQLQPFVTPDKVKAKLIELRLGFSRFRRENIGQSRGSTPKLQLIFLGLLSNLFANDMLPFASEMT